MGVVTFRSVNDIAGAINAGYSMYESGTATWSYLNNLDSGHDFATSVKGMDFLFNVGTFIYSQATRFEANQALAQLKLERAAEKFAKVGLPIDIASSA